MEVGEIQEKLRYIKRWLYHPNEGRARSCGVPGLTGAALWCWIASLVDLKGTSFFIFLVGNTQKIQKITSGGFSSGDPPPPPPLRPRILPLRL